MPCRAGRGRQGGSIAYERERWRKTVAFYSGRCAEDPRCPAPPCPPARVLCLNCRRAGGHWPRMFGSASRVCFAAYAWRYTRHQSSHRRVASSHLYRHSIDDTTGTQQQLTFPRFRRQQSSIEPSQRLSASPPDFLLHCCKHDAEAKQHRRGRRASRGGAAAKEAVWRFWLRIHRQSRQA